MPVRLTDLKRILLGKAPWGFTFEVFVRTLVLYLALVAALRLLGKRLNGQLTIVEMAVMITLGAIVSSPMEQPTRGVVFGFLLLLCALSFHRGVGRLGVSSEGFERLIAGDVMLLVKDGVLQLDALRHASLSHNIFYAELRSKGLRHLGEIQRVYLEACGAYAVLRRKKVKAGLSIFPEDERERTAGCKRADDCSACRSCGLVVDEARASRPCPHCGEHCWTFAVTC